jgi:hypothetical protein
MKYISDHKSIFRNDPPSVEKPILGHCLRACGGELVVVENTDIGPATLCERCFKLVVWEEYDEQ